MRLLRPGDHALGGETLEHRACAHPREPGDRYPPLSHDDLLAGLSTGEPVTEMCSKLGDRNVHAGSVQSRHLKMYARPLTCLLPLGPTGLDAPDCRSAAAFGALGDAGQQRPAACRDGH